MAYYQIENSLMPGHYDCRRYVDFAFSTHLHRDPELVIVLSGEIVLTVGARTETGRRGAHSPARAARLLNARRV